MSESEFDYGFSVDVSYVFLTALSLWFFLPVGLLIAALPVDAIILGFVQCFALIATIIGCAKLMREWSFCTEVAVQAMNDCTGFGLADFFIYLVGLPFFVFYELALPSDGSKPGKVKRVFAGIFLFE